MQPSIISKQESMTTPEPNPPERSGASRRDSRMTRPTAVCVATMHTTPPRAPVATPFPVAGALGDGSGPTSTGSASRTPGGMARSASPGPHVEGVGAAVPVRTNTQTAAVMAPEFVTSFDRHDLAVGFADSLRNALAAVEPQPQLELRVRAIYAVDDGVEPAWTLEHVRAALSTLVEAANRDLVGTGLRFVSFVRHDVEIRRDTRLRRDVVLPDDVTAALTSGQIGEAQGNAIIQAAAVAVAEHRNAVAAERPNAMLWIFSRGNRFEAVRDASNNFLRWRYVDDRGGSFSGGEGFFVALHEGFLSSLDWARQDASRAAHEVGHYLSLWHTHREPFHDLGHVVPPDVLDDPAPARLAAWQRAIAAWLDQQLPQGTSPGQAQATYDVDRGNGVLDTPPDPGAGIMALANEAAGHGPNELGPVATVTLDVPGVTGPVTLTPLRDNPMGYYLRETPDAMHFTPGQVNVMRNFLTNSHRRPLVAAQLGDTSTPDLRVCAVWSPSAAGQRLTWGWTLEGHAAEHERLRKDGFDLADQQAYTRNGSVFYDGIWDPGTRHQEVIWGWLDEHVHADVAARAARGMLPVSVQGYQHLTHGVRYNAIYEPGSGDARVLLGVTQDELSNAWATWMPKGYRMTCLSSNVDVAGHIRFSTVLRPAGTPQSWVSGWALADIAAEYGRQWEAGCRIRHISVVRIAEGHRWSAVFEPDREGQLVYWAHVRERISEVYDEMWAVDMKLRAMCAVPA
jgi:hypothetical protein